MSPYNPDDLGLDLLRAKALPECQCCRKKTDGAVTLYGFILCGTHFDEVSHLIAKAQARGNLRTDRTRADYVSGFVKGLREGLYKPCWDAELPGGLP